MLTVVTTPKDFSKDEILGAIEDYKSGTPERVICGQLGIATSTFKRWCLLHEEIVAKENNEESMGKHNYPAQRKARVKLNYKQRCVIIEARLSGATISALAERFDVATPTIRRTMELYEAGEIVLPVRETAPSAPVVVEPPKPEVPVLIEQVSSVTFEGDFIVIRIPKKQITRTLLKDIYE